MKATVPTKSILLDFSCRHSSLSPFVLQGAEKLIKAHLLTTHKHADWLFVTPKGGFSVQAFFFLLYNDVANSLFQMPPVTLKLEDRNEGVTTPCRPPPHTTPAP